ncbi:MAG: MFS transporter, partial [Burkholderiales bacterium]
MPSNSRLIAVSGILTFAFLGVIQSLYGPLLPELRREFAIDAATVGLVFSAHGFGALSGILAPSLIRAQAVTRRLLGIASGLLVLGAAALSIAPTWPVTLAAAFVLAVGFGIHVVRLNSLFVAGFGARGMAMSQLINAAFSVGAIVGPIVVGASGGASRQLFGSVALLALALLPLSIATDRKTVADQSDSAVTLTATTQTRKRRRSRLLLGAFIALMCLTVGVETSIGGWTATLALERGYSFATAANLTAMFFGSILIGRLLAAWLGHRIEPPSMVVAAIGCIVAIVLLSMVTTAG